MKRIALILVGVILIAARVSLTTGTEQPKEPPKFSARVKVSVGGDEEIRNSVTSYIKRELRSLGDVEIVDENEQWLLSILAMYAKVKPSGKKTGLILSVVVLQKKEPEFFEFLIGGDDDLKKKRTAQHLASYYCHFDGHSVATWPLDSMKEGCADIVTDFDVKSLEPMRKFYGDLQAGINKKATHQSEQSEKEPNNDH